MLVLLKRSHNVLSLLTVSLLFSSGKSQFKCDKEIAFTNNYDINTLRNPKTNIWFYLLTADSKRVKSSSQHFFLMLL